MKIPALRSVLLIWKLLPEGLGFSLSCGKLFVTCITQSGLWKLNFKKYISLFVYSPDQQ